VLVEGLTGEVARNYSHNIIDVKDMPCNPLLGCSFFGGCCEVAIGVTCGKKVAVEVAVDI
jgi:hypothetical protein